MISAKGPTQASSLQAVTRVHPAVDAMTDVQRGGFNFRRFWHSLLERIWIVAICVAVGFFIALGYLARTPKTYQAHAVLEVDFQQPSFVSGEDTPMRMRSLFLASQEALRTIEQNLTNREMLARVIRAEGLAEDNGAALLGTSLNASNTKKDSAPPKAATGSRDQPNVVAGMTFTPMEEALAGALSGMVKAAIRRGTRLIDVYVTNRDPLMSERLAEAVGREYIRNAIERRASFNQDALRYLIEEEDRLKLNLQKSEAAVAQYKETHPDALQLGGGTAATGSQAGSGAGGGGSRGGIVEDKLQDLSSKLTAVKTDRLRVEGELKQIQEAGKDLNALLEVPSVSLAPLVNEARHNVTLVEAEIATLSLRYKSKHPKMISANASLREAQTKLRLAVDTQPALLKNAIEQSKATEAELLRAVHEQEGTAVALNRTAIGFQELARQAETDRALYESVLRQIKQTDLTKDIKTDAVSVAEHASLPRSPINPIPSKTITFGLLAGLAVGLAFVFGADAVDRSVKTVDQAENALGLPVLAAIPETRGSDTKTVRDDNSAPREAVMYRLVDEAPSGPIAESFRNLRAALSLLGPEADRKVFLFTSALPNEGKSFTSVNFALALAHQGQRVLLVDGDLRRPSVHKVFRTEAENEEMPGVVDYLVHSVPLNEAVELVATVDSEASRRRATQPARKVGQLFILAGGERAPNPAELLSGESFQRLITEAAQAFDRVIIDSAPILAVSDTLLMAPYVQTISIVVRANKTPRNAIHRALTLLDTAGNRPAGIVLNRLPRRRGAGYYYYYASHGYGEGNGTYGDGVYGQESSRSATDHSGNGVS